MATEVLVALLAFLAALLSGGISWAVSRHQVKSELRRLRVELRHTYAGGLQAKRLEVYPGLYDLLSMTAKRVEVSSAGRRDLEELLAGVNEWDSANAVLVGVHAAEVLYEFRKFLRALLRQDDESIMQVLRKSPNELLSRIGTLEIAIKSDLGVLGVAFYDIEREWRSYKDLNEALRGRLRRAEVDREE
jgi:hypothetical protein